MLLLATPSLRAQNAHPPRIRGVVFDSVKAKPVAGATITAIRMSPAPPQFFSTTTDSAGRYVVDSLAPGQYSIGVSTPFLDSLELDLPQKPLALTDGAQIQFDFATPSRATLAAAACPGTSLPKGRGAIVGRVTNAETEAPLVGANVVVSWNDLGLDLATMKPMSQERTASVATDSLGQYRICGMPTDTYVILQIQQGGRAGTAVRSQAVDDAGVVLQNLSLSPGAARPIVTDSSQSAADTVSRLATGTASVTGTVRDINGQPLADAQVRVVDAAGSARSDATGHYALGTLPAGTQLLEVRRVGYSIAVQTVELRSGRAVQQDLRLARFVTLDSVRIVAQRTKFAEFERRTGSGRSAATVITEATLEQAHVSETGDLFHGGRVLGFQLVGQGLDAKVRSTRGVASLNMSCVTNVVIDGMQHQDINLVAPSSIHGIEVYRGASGAPTEYDSSCGVILIWTKR